MNAPDESGSFSFEHTMNMDEEVYVSIWQSPRASQRRFRWLRRAVAIIVLGAVVFACFLSIYTVVLGALILAFFLWILYTARPGRYQRMYREQQHFRGPVSFGTTESGVWAKGEQFEVRAKWPLIRFRQIRGDWLILSPRVGTNIFLPVSSMKRVGVYDRVMELAQRYGMESRHGGSAGRFSPRPKKKRRKDEA